MGITNNNAIVAPYPVDGVEWAVSMYSADLEGGEMLKAAVAGHTQYIKKLKIRSATATIISIGDAADTGALTHTFLGPIAFLIASSTDFDLNFGPEKALKLTDSLGLAIIQVGDGATWIWAEGKTCKT